MLLGREQERQSDRRRRWRRRARAPARRSRWSGEPGIGKTALLDYARRGAAGRHAAAAGPRHRVRGADPVRVAARADPPGPGAARADPAAAGGRAGGRAGAAARSRPRTGSPSAPPRSACSPRTPSRRPVAVLVDDAQWLDGSSAQALLFAFRRLVADPIAVLVAVREGEPSLLDGADLPVLRLGGLTSDEAAALRARAGAGGGPAAAPGDGRQPARAAGARGGRRRRSMLAPEGAPVLVLGPDLAARSCAAAGQLDQADPAGAGAGRGERHRRPGARSSGPRRSSASTWPALAAAESAGLVTLQPGTVEFRHPLARSAVYADAPAGQRREAHRALAAALPDRDVDRRAWHLAAAAAGTGRGGVRRAGAGGEPRAGTAARTRPQRRRSSGPRGSPADSQRAGEAAAARRPRRAGWPASPTGPSRCSTRPARWTGDRGALVEIDELAGHIATRCGPVMRGHAILTAAAGQADPERAVGDAGRGGRRLPLRRQPGRDAAPRRAGRGALPAGRRRRAPASWPRWPWAWPGSSAVTPPPAPTPCTKRSRWPKARPSCARISRLLPWLALGPLFLRRDRRRAVAARARTADRPGARPRSVRSRSCST